MPTRAEREWCPYAKQLENFKVAGKCSFMSCFQMGFNYFYRVENPIPQLSDKGQVVQVGARDVKKWQRTDLGAHLPHYGGGTSPLSCLPHCKKEGWSTDY